MSRLCSNSLLLGLLVVAGLGVAAAQSPSGPVPERTVVTVTARPVPLETSAADISILDADAVERGEPRVLTDVLRTQPGIHVAQAGQRGGSTTISIRGGDPNFTLFLLDGVPVNDITDQLGGTVDLGTILPLLPSRIEIVRGPMSALYGSEAVSGVVNMITETKGMPPLSVRLASGSFGTVEGGIEFGWWRPKYSFSFGGAGVRVGEQVRRDSFLAGDNSARLDVFLARNTLLALTGRYGKHSITRFPANSGGPIYALNPLLESVDGSRLLGGLSLRHSTDRWWTALSADSGVQEVEQDAPAILDRFPPSYGYIPPTLSSTSFVRNRVQGSLSYQLMPGWSATAGGSYRYENGRNKGSITGYGPTDYQLRRTTGAVLGETVVDRKRWSLVAAFRSDWVAGQTSRVSPRVGGSVRSPWRGGRLRASAGKGFKMPSFYALGHPMVGNPALLPETSNAADAGVEQSLGRLGIASLNVFRSVYRDLIDFSPSEFRLVNRSEAVSRGIDFSWRGRISGVSLQSHATYSASYLRNSPDLLRDSPRWRMSAVVSRRLRDRVTAHLEGLWVSSRYDFEVPVPEKSVAPSYLVVNSAVQLRLKDSVLTSLRIDNLLNRKFQEYVGFPNPGIGVSAGVKYTLK
ncbi:MAG: TonB-dependent receptor plug domain-containing protein [Bryobacteraceae bacterium]